MNTLLMLLARYNRHAISFEEFCHDFLGVALKTGQNRRSLGDFPVTVMPNGAIDLRDAAEYWERERERARNIRP
jgi:hypothetical protein